MRKTIGVIIYEIHPHGNLTGIWVNNHRDIIYSEMCRKRGSHTDEIPGTYSCAYFDHPDILINNELQITLGQNGVFHFLWKNLDGDNVFHGVGMNIDANRIAASFWE